MPPPMLPRLSEAVAAAKTAFAQWSAATPQQRFDCLDAIGTEILARREELGRLLSREEGKPLADGIGEAARAATYSNFSQAKHSASRAMSWPRSAPASTSTVTREPLGVVGLITPWNFPAAIPAWKIAPGTCLWQHGCVQARRAGVRPPPGPSSDIAARSGLPKGVLNLVMGKGSIVGQAIIEQQGYRRGELHRLASRRCPHRPELRGARRRNPAGDGRQESPRRAR